MTWRHEKHEGLHYVVHIEQKSLHICLFHNPPVGRCRCWGQRSACAVRTTHYWPQWGVLGEPLWPPPHSQAPQRLNAVPLNGLLKNTQKIHRKYFKKVLQYCIARVGQRLSAQQPTRLYFFPLQTCIDEICSGREICHRAKTTGGGRGSVYFGTEMNKDKRSC